MGLIRNLINYNRQQLLAQYKNEAQPIDLRSWVAENFKGGTMRNKTSDVKIEKKHLYRGYGYGIIKSIVNTGIVTAEENVRTTCSTAERERLADKNEQIEHPYRKLWRNSPYFSEYDFWKQYLTYIQMNGEFYIYMNRKRRAGNGNKMYPTNYMKLINPAEMTPKSWDKDGNVTEWTRTTKSHAASGANFVQTYPAYQIIHVVELDPLDPDRAYSLLDATKENLFTLENAKDFTRHALVSNVNAPGIIAVNGEFESQEQFDNYVSMLQNHEPGDWIIAAGNAETKAQELSQNLDGASQEKIRTTERDEMLVTAGVSKSILGIETTGLTRDVAATQKLTFVEKTVIPYIKLMLETLNFDYRVNYAEDFDFNKYILHVTNPSTSDKTQELKELEVREEEYNMVQRYVNRGYTSKSAAQFVRGEIDVEQLQLEQGDKTKMTPQESVELVDAAERWEALIAAGNDPQSVIDLIEGRITMAKFIEINQNVAPADSPTPTDETPADDSDGRTPDEYYDPDPEDYGTPRDEKETPADKKEREKQAIQAYLDVLSQETTPITAKNLSLQAFVGFHPQTKKRLLKEVKRAINALYEQEKQAILVQTCRKSAELEGKTDQELLDLANSNQLPRSVRTKIQGNLAKLDYGKINAKLKKA